MKEPNKQALRSSNIKELFNKSNLNCIHSREVKVLDRKTLVPSNFHFKHLNPIPPTRLPPTGKLVLPAPKIKNVREEGTLALFRRGMNYGAPPSPPNIPGRPPLLRVPALAWATGAFCGEAEWPAPGWESLSGVGAGWGWGGQPQALRAAQGPEVAVTRGGRRAGHGRRLHCPGVHTPTPAAPNPTGGPRAAGSSAARPPGRGGGLGPVGVGARWPWQPGGSGPPRAAPALPSLRPLPPALAAASCSAGLARPGGSSTRSAAVGFPGRRVAVEGAAGEGPRQSRRAAAG